MTIRTLKSNISNIVINIKGWRTNRKIIVIESDDWGAERTPSKEKLIALKKKGFDVDRCHYMLNDSLASEQDLEYLFDVLLKYKDKNEASPIITSNCLMANPDFKKIEQDNFNNYHFEHFTKTLQKYPRHNKSLEFWKKGIELGVFYPQSHGREHLNISRWMHDLQNEVKETRTAFDLGYFAVSGHIVQENRGSYLAAFDGSSNELIYDRTTIINNALDAFNKTFGFPSKTFIAPNYIWDKEIEFALSNKKVKWLQGVFKQKISSDYGDKKSTRRHYLGEQNKLGQRYLVRNAHFEPSSNTQKDWIDSTLKEIDLAFKFKKPAIIGSHRVNFIGYINQQNRDRNLKLLVKLLERIMKKWPEVEFMNSARLGTLIENKYNG